MKFEFMTANRIIFERGSISRIGKLAKELGTKVLLTTGMPPETTEKVVKLLKDEGLDVVVVVVTKEPSIENLEVSLELARKEKVDVVVGFGGGSAMDTGKIISAMIHNPGEVLDYLEVIGKGMTLAVPSIPCIAVPTTSGTGAEVTKNSVLGSVTNKVKVSLRSPFLLPKIVLLDPEMTVSVPPAVTASTGLDALTQVIEPFVSNAANPFTDAFCREGMKRASGSLRRAFDDGTDIEARVDMSLASLMGGLALANAKLGAVHGFAGVLGGMYPIPHGVCCATLLPYTIKTNVEALSSRLPDSEYLKRFDEVGQILTGNPKANARDAVKWIQDLCAHLNVPRLSAFGITEKEFPEIVEKSKVASSMKGNPIVLSDEELFAILKSAL
jgi:alcohol dehydrogenase class IV